MRLKAWITQKNLEQEFLHAQVEEPWDPLHYLAYADWLEENNRDEDAQVQREGAQMVQEMTGRADVITSTLLRDYYGRPSADFKDHLWHELRSGLHNYIDTFESPHTYYRILNHLVAEGVKRL